MRGSTPRRSRSCTGFCAGTARSTSGSPTRGRPRCSPHSPRRAFGNGPSSSGRKTCPPGRSRRTTSRGTSRFCTQGRARAPRFFGPTSEVTLWEHPKPRVNDLPPDPEAGRAPRAGDPKLEPPGGDCARPLCRLGPDFLLFESPVRLLQRAGICARDREWDCHREQRQRDSPIACGAVELIDKTPRP